ncbi:hypothetical protein [Rubrivirga sp.]|uniref:hypothetical protein n=1 Tax=Rubrivirga sp. TaxID=1885344 RepID=UPI003C71A271
MRFRSLALLAFAVSISACDSTVDELVPSPSPVLPLAVGAEWTLQEAYSVRYERDGTVGDTLRRAREDRYTVRVERDSTIEGEAWYRIDAPRGFYHCVFEDGVWLTNRSDGLYRFRASAADAELVYATGLEVGVPFIDTFEVLAVLEDESAAGRHYLRTWRGADQEWGRGPISPSITTRDLLSLERGLVALEISFVQQGATDSTFIPAATIGYEVAETGAAASRSDAAAVRVDNLPGHPLGGVGAEPRD